MEAAPLNTSTLPQNPSKNRTFRLVYAIAGFSTLFGVLIGATIAIIVYMLPYDRLVVFNQPSSTTVKLASVKLSGPAFVVLYMQKTGGWQEVGWTWFGTAGYYRDVVIDVGYQQEIEELHKDNTPGNYEPRAFVVRIEKLINPGTVTDQFVIKEPLLDKHGQIYQKRFWWEPRDNKVKLFFIRLRDDPFGYLWDVIWP